MAKVNRKLATILATDCVDFSKHMESQEELTLSNLTSCREIIDPVIEEHGGRIFHTAGDSVIADFGSPVECVNAAMKFQDLLAARNEAISDGLKLQWRVGIHVDDVISAMFIALNNQEKIYDVYNVAPKDPATVNEIANIVLAEMDILKSDCDFKYTG